MSDNKDDYAFRSYRSERTEFWKWAVWLGFAFIAIAVIWGIFGTAVTVVSVPGRIVNRTLGTDNIINNYEWFHDTSEAFNARNGQIKSHKAAMEAARTDKADGQMLDRYRVELEGMRQSCRDLAARYNANADKSNRAIFMGRDVPDRLNANLCNS